MNVGRGVSDFAKYNIGTAVFQETLKQTLVYHRLCKASGKICMTNNGFVFSTASRHNVCIGMASNTSFRCIYH